MDDSDPDFSILCSRLLKRVRRKGESGDEKKETPKDEESNSHAQNTDATVVSSQRKAPSKRKIQNNGLLHTKVTGRTQLDCRPNGNSQLTMDVDVKAKVLRRMQRFKRASPPRLLHTEKVDNVVHSDSPYNEIQPHPPPGSTEQPKGDEVLALRLQEQLDSEAQTRAMVDVEDGGLFFCQLCHKDLSAMSPRLRAQHINRCLDKSENAFGALHALPPPPSRPRVPECPICGRGFKSEKSRSVHLKRCSASMGVSPAELLQALQRQAAESLSDTAAIQLQQAGGSRTAEASSMPVRKKARRKAPRMDEDTMVALALSRSLLEQEQEREREEERQIQAQLSSTATAAPPPPVLQWRPAAGTCRGKRRRYGPASPPPLLLVQDPQVARSRIQERVSSLLLQPRPPTPPTPTLPPSILPTCVHSAPFWQKSALPGGGPDSVCEFYTPELSAFIQPWVGSEKKPSVCSEGGTPQRRHPEPLSEPASAPLSLEQKGADRPSSPDGLTPALGTPGSQALRDLVELAEEGMTLTQYACPDKEAAAAELPLSGFVPESTETAIPSTSTVTSVSISRLCSDLGSMVNNPQLSDIHLQVDSGEVYFAHSFMLYTRCPLLVNMVHNAGFGVREEDLPHAQRVLLGDVPGEAVCALLQYLYTASCPLTHTLLPHVLQLAIRFGLSDLQQQCEQYSRHAEDPREEAQDVYPAQEPPSGPQQSLAEAQFLELLRSMWQHESDSEEVGKVGGAATGEEGQGDTGGEMKEERVDEQELEEIYEFAATQRKTEVTAEAATDSDDEEEEDEGGNNCFEEKQHVDGERESVHAFTCCFKEANTSCHSYRLGMGGDVAAMVTSPSDMHHAQDLRAAVRLGSDGHAGPEQLPDSSLNRSYSRLFSQSWGEYAEPSQSSLPAERGDTSAPQCQSLVREVIDLSVSPPAEGSGEGDELSLPTAGVSPRAGEGSGAEQDRGGKPALDCQSRGHVIVTALSSSTTNSPQSGLMSNSSKHSNEPSVSRPESLQSVQSSRPDLTPSGPSCNQPELIVLSDSSDDMDLHVTPGKVSPPHRVTPMSLSPSPLRLSQSRTQTRAKDNLEISLSPKRTNRAANHVSVHIECPKPDQSVDDLCGIGVGNMLDGSAEVSWLIPATPEPSTRTSSTQTHCSMRPTQLFPKAQTSTSSLSSTLDVSKADPECSPDFRKPMSFSRLSHASCPTLSDTSRDDSMKWKHPRPHSASKPCSSTPLHSDPPLRSLDSLGSPLLKGHELGPQTGSGREGSQSSKSNMSLHLSPSQGSSSQANSSDPWEEASVSPPQCRSLSCQIPRIPPNADTDKCITERGTKEKEQGGVKDGEQLCGNEVVKDAEVVSDEAGCPWALDEPPMAFDDSWGLAGPVGDKAARFSLRLESSGDHGVSPEHRGQSRTHSPHKRSLPEQGDTTPPSSEAPPNHSLPDPEVWDSWEEEDEEEDLPLSQRVGTMALDKRVAQLKTPVARKKKNHAPLEPITPMPGFSDMDTPELKTRLNRYGVRPLPKKQMVLKLKEIHQYTHQLMSSESEEEASPLACSKARLTLAAPALQTGCNAMLTFKKPTAPPPVSPKKLQFDDDKQEELPGSQDSNTSSTAESDRSNPELCGSDDDDSDTDSITASQAAVREQDQLAAVRSFILSDPLLYRKVLQYQPLSLANLKASLRAAGIRLGTAKLLDVLDSQCITFTTAKPGQAAPSRRRARARAPRHAGGRGRKRVAKPAE